MMREHSILPDVRAVALTRRSTGTNGAAFSFSRSAKTDQQPNLSRAASDTGSYAESRDPQSRLSGTDSGSDATAPV
jgi:hypothetical protein